MVELFMCGFVEVKRWQDFRKPGSQTEKGSFLGFESSFKPMANGYPGGIFDPLGLSRCVGAAAAEGRGWAGSKGGQCCVQAGQHVAAAARAWSLGGGSWHVDDWGAVLQALKC
jgi:hypothetical protein